MGIKLSFRSQWQENKLSVSVSHYHQAFLLSCFQHSFHAHKSKYEGTLDSYHQSTAFTFTMEETKIEILSGPGSPAKSQQERGLSSMSQTTPLSICSKHLCQTALPENAVLVIQYILFED